LYASPHIISFDERIYLSGKKIKQKELKKILLECEKKNGKNPITFFEITTAAAFVAFSKQRADFLLLEVGLGGRFDATNVLKNPLMSIITSIGIDHTEFLGSSIAKISKEKAGIMRKNCPVIIGPQKSKVVKKILFEESKLVGAKPFTFEKDWHCSEKKGFLVFQDNKGEVKFSLKNLTGQEHQLENAGIAIAALRKLKLKKLTTKNYATLSKSQLIGRYQTITKGKLIKIIKPSNRLIIDGCHNVLGAQELTKTVRKKEKGRDIVFIVGMLNSKDSKGFFKEVKKIAQSIYTIAIPNQINSIPAKELAFTAKQIGIKSKAFEKLETALKNLSQNHPNSTIIISGSLYLAGEALKANKPN